MKGLAEPLQLFVEACMIKLESDISPASSKKVAKGLIILVVILFIGAAGYMSIEGWGFLDSVYMTVITITTVGFGEVREVTRLGRVFTIFIIFFGIGIIAYILGMVAQAMVELQVRSILGRRKLGQKIRSIKNHYIICGFGRIGKIISRELKATRCPRWAALQRCLE